MSCIREGAAGCGCQSRFRGRCGAGDRGRDPRRCLLWLLGALLRASQVLGRTAQGRGGRWCGEPDKAGLGAAGSQGCLHQLGQGLLGGLPRQHPALLGGKTGLCLCRGSRPLLEEGPQRARGLAGRRGWGAVLWGLAGEGARGPECLALLQQALLVPLHQEGLELLLLLGCQVPQLRVLGQDTLELRPDLAHHRPRHLPQETWRERGRARRWHRRPCFVLPGTLEPWGLRLALQRARRPLAWLLWRPRHLWQHHALRRARPTAQ